MYNIEDVVIIVPSHEKELSPTEIISLSQLCSVLNMYDICFVVPEGLEPEYAHIDNINVSVETFPREYFTSVGSYCSLCRTKRFYERFSAYKFMLIYQLDAFVFSDQLLDFCNLDFDYIGAPIPADIWKYTQQRVGNGGFSLRKIESMVNVLDNADYIAQVFNEEYGEDIDEIMLLREDEYYAYCGQLDNINFLLADEQTAIQFSVEYDTNDIYRKLNAHIPFGCHRWNNLKVE